VKQVENVRSFGIPVVVAVNSFQADTAAEHDLIKTIALKAGACAAVSHSLHANGGDGGVELADAVREACTTGGSLEFTYAEDDPLELKIEKIATRVYGADGIMLEPSARASVEILARMGYLKLPVCMAKTHLSLSHDPELKGRPAGWTLPIRDVRLSAGAGFFYALCGEVMTMPGLPARPAGERVDIDAEGNVKGLF
jgi:formate--tetrahydrofolate ligase